MTSERIIACRAVFALRGMPRTLRGVLSTTLVGEAPFLTLLPGRLPALTESLLSLRGGAAVERLERLFFSIGVN